MAKKNLVFMVALKNSERMNRAAEFMEINDVRLSRIETSRAASAS